MVIEQTKNIRGEQITGKTRQGNKEHTKQSGGTKNKQKTIQEQTVDKNMTREQNEN